MLLKMRFFMKNLLQQELVRMNSEILKVMNSLFRKKIVIYPFNQAAINLRNFIENASSVKVDFFLDKEPSADKNQNTPVVNFFDFADSYENKEDYIVLLANKDSWWVDLWDIQWVGISDERILNYMQFSYYLFLQLAEDYKSKGVKQEILYKPKNTALLKFLSKFKTSYELFEDEKSKKIFLRLLLKKIYSCEFFFDVLSQDAQYFEKDIINLNDKEVFFDCGGYDGDTSSIFIEKTEGKYERIFFFEPSLKPFKNAIDKLKDYNNITFLNVGLYDKNGSISFINTEMGASFIEEAYVLKDNKESFKTTQTVIVGDKLEIKPTFIKMDLEGSEISALKGLKKTISKYSPKLAISVYHKDSDLYKIPQLIKKYNENYKLYLRHYSSTGAETVCYAIPK